MSQYLLLAVYCYIRPEQYPKYLLLAVYCYTVTSGRNNVPIFTVGWLLLHRYIWPEQFPNICCWLSTVTPLHLAGTMSQYLLLAVYCYTVTSGRNNVPIFSVGCLLLHRYIRPEQYPKYLLLAVYCYTVTSGRNNIYCWLATVKPLHLAGTISQYLLLAVYCYTVTSGRNNVPIFTVGWLLLHRYIWPEQFPNICCWLSTVTPLHLAGTMSQYLLLAVYCYTVTSGRNNVPIFSVGCLLLHRYIRPEQYPKYLLLAVYCYTVTSGRNNIYCWLATVTPLHLTRTISQYLLLAGCSFTVTSGRNNVPIFTVGCLLLHRYIWPEQCPNIYCWLSVVTPLHLAERLS